MKKFDVIIVGSGLGGLECGAILSKEGFNVCVLEKNRVLGGCLQSFKRHNKVLDTGIHYVGSMDPGQILHQFFKYFDINDKIKTRRLDADGFDQIHFQDKIFNYAIGYENFAETMSSYFPEEKENIYNYTKKLKEVCNLISVDNLKKGILNIQGMDYFAQSAAKVIDHTVNNNILRNVLAGTNTLYGGVRNDSTFYHHAMINASNIEGPHRIVDGSQAIADALVAKIRENGGTVLTSSQVTRFVVENNNISSVEVNGNEIIEAKHFISNLHPSVTFQLVDKTPAIKKAFLSRINSLPNSYGIFTLYLILKKNTLPYINKNIYLIKGDDVWTSTTNPLDYSVRNVLLSYQSSSTNPNFTEVISVLNPMFLSEVEKWSDTSIGRRGDSYETFKQNKAQEILDFITPYAPEIIENIENIHTSTPLTYRDYTATPEGSAYGIIKNCNNPLVTLIPTRTKIDNLFLTGQNLNVHGALGVTLTAAHTCAHLIGSEYLAKKIGEA